jgi:hypothetical protein
MTAMDSQIKEYPTVPLEAGQLYRWGPDNVAGSLGLVVRMQQFEGDSGGCFYLIDPFNGEIWLAGLSLANNSADLRAYLPGNVQGPYSFKLWLLQEWKSNK